MHLMLDNRTLTMVQVVVSMVLCIAMAVAWRTQRTYPGFGRWTIAKIPNFLGWLLISLHGMIPDWASVLVANLLLVVSPILIYEGIRQFVGKPHRDAANYALNAALLAALMWFTWVHPNVNLRVMAISLVSAVILLRCAAELLRAAPPKTPSGFMFTAVMFIFYVAILVFRAATTGIKPSWSDPFRADAWQSILFVATNIIGISWTFGFFMMTNSRLTRELRKADADVRHMAAVERRDRVMAQAISEVALTFTKTLDLSEILNRVLVEAGRIVPNALASVLLVEEGVAKVGSWLGVLNPVEAASLEGLRLSVAGNENLHRMAETGKAVIISDTRKLDYWKNKTSPMHAYIAAPIRLQEETIGFINLEHAQPGFYTPRHAEQLQTFADLCSIAIENARLFQKTQILANTDELTGICNKRFFSTLAAGEIKRAQRYGKRAVLLMLDLDHFKEINDDHGHPAGDRALKTLGELLTRTLRSTDLVGRYGGDEFILLLPETDTAGALAIAGRLLEEIRAARIETERSGFSLTASIGLASLEEGHASLDELIQDADRALYRAKDLGRDRAEL